MKIERQAGRQGPVFKLIGKLEGGAARQLERMLSGPASDGGVVTVDLSGLESCDAEGVAVFVTLTNRARVGSGALVLTSPSAEILQVFDTGGALDALTISPDAGDADTTKAKRYLFRVGDELPFAYASSRRDFSLVSDDSLWAHESQDWLLAAGSGAVLAHRTRGSYYSADDGARLYSDQPTT